MKLLIVLGNIFVPLLFYLVQWVWPKTKIIFNGIAVLSFMVFSSIASLGIYSVIRDHEVYMTSIHGLFLNPFFLISASYLGIYLLYRLWLITTVE
ncbi:hypothetical protein [Shimazuella kribbensis]|uniref:hypothetical protein n=1 Tax=Shimazuella kribbensis TaxID=139808 RepID=UPI00041F22E5|nr:hypothetical protein [Shimazuella kribbensis]